MLENLLSILLALFGIGFLVFIHELGHYWMARRVGIRVEVFAIGFGKSIYEWQYKGVKWKIGCLPFGGYVKMAGTEKKGSIEPYQVPDGFFGKTPWQRIQVAFMGPLANMAFAFIAFSLLWFVGGRFKPFQEFTHYIGEVEKDSPLYKEGVRPGDLIETFNGHSIKGYQDLLYGAYLGDKTAIIKGKKVDYFTGHEEPFEYDFGFSPSLKGPERGLNILTTLAPANYLLYDQLANGKPNPLQEGSPLKDSGLVYGDRLVWLDGELLFSKEQLLALLNEPKVLLTVERSGSTFLTRVPRLKVADLRLGEAQMGEIDDWRYVAGLTHQKADDLFFIPYSLTPEAIVESGLGYVDEHSKAQIGFAKSDRSSMEIPLENGDRIVAVDGLPIVNGYGLLGALQKHHAQIIVERQSSTPPSWKEADRRFATSYDIGYLEKIINSIGTNQLTQAAGDFRLLRSVVPIAREDYPFTSEQKAAYELKLSARLKAIEQIKDEKEREEALEAFELQKKSLMLGVFLQDQQVRYNPSPWQLFGGVFQEVFRTLQALITGFLSPKNLTGPVGIVQMVHSSWLIGFKEGLFWLAMISLNLGLFNLLPVPVLDGGYILLALVESVTKKPLKAKTMERLLLPFVFLLIAFFVYITFHDFSRLFH